MPVFEVHSRITHRSLMNKSKAELAHQVMELLGDLDRERARRKATCITWQPYDRAHFQSRNNIAGVGGFFKEGMRWADYVQGICSSEFTGRMEELRTEILARGIRVGGRWHQQSGKGVPAWPDGVLFQASWRGWADLMAAVWSTQEGEDYSYMDFYGDAPPPAQMGALRTVRGDQGETR